jgi:hypothetical protein
VPAVWKMRQSSRAAGPDADVVQQPRRPRQWRRVAPSSRASSFNTRDDEPAVSRTEAVRAAGDGRVHRCRSRPLTVTSTEEAIADLVDAITYGQGEGNARFRHEGAGVRRAPASLTASTDRAATVASSSCVQPAASRRCVPNDPAAPAFMTGRLTARRHAGATSSHDPTSTIDGGTGEPDWEYFEASGNWC